MNGIYNLCCASTWRGRRYLVSPLVDMMFAGGAAFVIVPLLFWMFPLDANGASGYMQVYIASVAFAFLAHIVNHPHFMASYYLMYDDFKNKIAMHRLERSHMAWRYLFAGVIVPVVLIGYLIYAFVAQDNDIFAWGVYVLFFTVGWHYCKQAFGVMLVLSALKGVYYGRLTRRILWINAMLVWFKTWLGGNLYVPNVVYQPMNYQGVSFNNLQIHITPMMMDVLNGFLWLYGGLSLLLVVYVAIKQRIRPSLCALLGYSSMYSLLLFSYYHPLWAYMTPFFHSGQYLLFVIAYKRGEHHHHIHHLHMPIEQSRDQMKRFVGVCFIMGLLSFKGIPGTMEWLTDSHALRAVGIMLPFIYAFDIFINVHHYFIDNVLWRKDNPKVGRYLFYKTTTPSS
ncbi:MAG: hypothetical protein EAY76_01200 [Alphaproteobacteria bacterium]|nr:MAG: hypothetical protein EAY76_01200 [Alphaproteobacteria bacterium]TAF41924.1 MAG: hypothetical protein EAZ66_00405 [Alphaproteobacteria bacterium]TAF76773.1 MAG: hypothetical protein EAZ52_03200 [Alphaproteobacteria bacterium]